MAGDVILGLPGLSHDLQWPAMTCRSWPKWPAWPAFSTFFVLRLYVECYISKSFALTRRIQIWYPFFDKVNIEKNYFFFRFFFGNFKKWNPLHYGNFLKSSFFNAQKSFWYERTLKFFWDVEYQVQIVPNPPENECNSFFGHKKTKMQNFCFLTKNKVWVVKKH